MTSTELESQVRALLAQGDKAQAVKLVHENTGWGLKASKDYVDGLAKTGPPTSTPQDYRSLPPAELLDALEWAGRTPDLELIRACLERPEELTPELLDMLAEGGDDDWNDDDPRWYRAVHAGQLLCAFREPAALPIFGRVFRDKEQDNMLEWFDQDLPAAYGPAAMPMLLDLINDTRAYDYPRSSAMGMLTIVAHNHPQERERIVAALRALLPPLTVDGTLPPNTAKHPEIWTWVAHSLSELRDHDSQAHVLALYRAKMIDEWVMGDEKEYLAHFGQHQPQPRTYDILQTYEWLHEQVAQEARWKIDAERRAAERAEGAAAQARQQDQRQARQVETTPRPTQSQPKVGRNAPCPCGSGKKYKHCCMRKG